MRFIHTSDWHLGRRLFGKSRYDEAQSFLDWLIETIDEHHVQALLVSGDVFDTSTPSNRAQELYYRFLAKVSSTCCEHVVITSGNHDSPSFLEAPREILKYMNVHVRASVSEDIEDEVILLNDTSGTGQIIVCAVPYLRDRDIRTVEPGESIEDKDRKRREGIARHYEMACEQAEKQVSNHGHKIPIVAMGHLFTTGASTADGDGVRELYVGSLYRLGVETFPDSIDYLALGHLHQAQLAGKISTRRYSGAPMAMGFGDAKIQHEVLLVDMNEQELKITPLAVPRFRHLETIRGDMKTISEKIQSISSEHPGAWVEIIYEGKQIHGNLTKTIYDMTDGLDMEILRIQDLRATENVLAKIQVSKTLEELDEIAVFERCLDANDIPEEQRKELMRLYSEILETVLEQKPAISDTPG